MTLGINILGYHDSSIGHAESCRLITQCLQREKFPVNCISFPLPFEFSSYLQRRNKLEDCTKQIKYPINLFSINQADTEFLIKECFNHSKIINSYNILVWFWECDKIPKEYSSCFKFIDEIWVTSRYMYEMLAKEKTPPLFYVKHPIELNYQQKYEFKKKFNLPNKFTFLFFLNWIIKRKNPEAVLKAFKRAFPNNNDVQLIVKAQNSKEFINTPYFKNIMQEDSRIIWIDEEMGRNRFEIMNVCDCFISLHRSEGFGLTMAEAMLMGKPVIATGFSGNMDFMTPENSFPCSYELVEIGSGSPPYPEKGIWAEPNIDHAAQLMQHIYNNQEDAKIKAAQGKKDLIRDHCYSVIATTMIERLKTIEQSRKSQNFRKRVIQKSKLLSFFPAYRFISLARYTKHKMIRLLPVPIKLFLKKMLKAH